MMKKILFALCCLSLIPVVAYAATESPPPVPVAPDTAMSPTPALTGASAEAQAPAEAPSLEQWLRNVDPLSGIVQQSCGSCFESLQECKATCGGLRCIDTFNCDNANPCGYTCICSGCGP